MAGFMLSCRKAYLMKTNSILVPIIALLRKSMIPLMLFLLVSSTMRLKAQVILSFHAELRKDAVYFSWELMPNTTYQLLEAERSPDMITYSTCLAVNNQNGKLFGWDKQPLSWISYYRLKVTESNGQVSYSTSVMIRNSQISKNNHATGNSIFQQDGSPEPTAIPVNMIVICDITGNHCKVWKPESSDVQPYRQFENRLPSGIPYMIMRYQDDQLIEKLIKIKKE